MSTIKRIDQVDRIVEARCGKPLVITRLDKNTHLISRKGNVFQIERLNLEEKINQELQ